MFLVHFGVLQLELRLAELVLGDVVFGVRFLFVADKDLRGHLLNAQYSPLMPNTLRFSLASAMSETIR